MADTSWILGAQLFLGMLEHILSPALSLYPSILSIFLLLVSLAPGLSVPPPHCALGFHLLSRPKHSQAQFLLPQEQKRWSLPLLHFWVARRTLWLLRVTSQFSKQILVV